MERIKFSRVRLPSSVKEELAEAARLKRVSATDLLEWIVREWLARCPRRSASEEDIEELRKRLPPEIAPFVGCIKGGLPPSDLVRGAVQAVLARKYGR